MGDKIIMVIYILTFGIMISGWTYVAFALMR